MPSPVSAKVAADLERFTEWARDQELVRALIITSTHAVPNARLDVLSDYDLILILTDIHPFHENRDWLNAFGTVLALYRDPIEQEGGFEKSGNIVQFEGGLKIDFTLTPVGLFQRIAAQPQLPDEYDAGYRVLLDKDGLTAGLKPPSYQAYIPTPPTESEYLENIEVAFIDAAYVAKFLWRDDVIAAKEVLDHFFKQEHLIPMLVWRAEIDHGWTVKPGPLGRGLKRWLRPDLWTEFASTYADADVDANWDVLFKSLALMKQVALEVGAHFGYAYPEEMEQRAIAHLHKVHTLPPNADNFS
jgi:aminoglycoside 6-adenylyltransferase